ncbi:hypothetical protein K438DRAFT_1995431 [Mycena galopus ATCC 62051]|nr:hypothetical protein K438DRAFT_1995431 [Mycena galopus ATCC 62051]
MSEAQDVVMRTPELLERTLSQLPMRDLLVAAPLRVLFFEPDPGTSTELVQNPLIEFFPPFFRDVASKRVQ